MDLQSRLLNKIFRTPKRRPNTMTHNQTTPQDRMRNMTPSITVGFSPYYEDADSLAKITSPTLYITELGCHFTQSLYLSRNKKAGFVTLIKKQADKFFELPDKESFEARIGSGDDLLIILITPRHTGYYCSLFSNVSMDHVFDFIDEYKTYFTQKQDDDIEVTYYYKSTREGLSSHLLYIPKNKLGPIYPELYPDIDIERLLHCYITAQEPIMLLNGTPGTGKTSFIKFLLTSGKFERIAYIKDPDVMNMGDLWAALTGTPFDLLIFDDLDVGLSPRSQDPNSKFMTQLLSFSDGIFHSTNTKIIITTNQEILEIDSALVRAGRCFDFIQLHSLTRQQAHHAWVTILKLNGEQFDKIFKKDQTISQAALMSEAGMIHSKTSRDYIKNDNRLYTLAEKLQSMNIKISDSPEQVTGFNN